MECGKKFTSTLWESAKKKYCAQAKHHLKFLLVAAMNKYKINIKLFVWKKEYQILIEYTKHFIIMFSTACVRLKFSSQSARKLLRAVFFMPRRIIIMVFIEHKSFACIFSKCFYSCLCDAATVYRCGCFCVRARCSYMWTIFDNETT